MILSKDIHWLAGWLEGEGSFFAHKTGAGPRGRKQRVYGDPRLSGASVDKDTMERVAKILDANLRGPYLVKHYQPYYQVSLSGSNAIGWMMTIYSLMGLRRRQQIRRAIAAWKLCPSTPQTRSRLRKRFLCH